MNTYNKSSLQGRLGLVILLLLLIASAIFYKERMLFCDPAWITFNIINKGEFVISEHRYSAFFTQIFPFIAFKMEASIKTILFLYSISFYLLYSSIGFIIYAYFKKYEWVLLLAFYFTLGVSDVYFWPNNEVHQGIAWLVFYFAFFSQKEMQPKFFSHLLLATLAFIALSSHLLVAVVAFFYFMYNIIPEKKISTNTKIVQFGVLLFFAVSRYQMSRTGWYDGEKLQAVNNVTLDAIFGIFSSGQLKSYAQLLLSNYWTLIIVFSIGLIHLVNSKKWYLLFIVMAFTFIYICLVCLTFPESYDRSLQFYMESEWAPLSIIMAGPFVFDFLPKLSINKMKLFLIVIFISRLPYLIDSYFLFHNRLKNLEAQCIQSPNNGLIKMDNNMAKETFLMPWGLPIETMMYSCLKNNVPNKTIKLVDPTFSDTINPQSQFYSCFRIEEKTILNDQYFNLDTTPYLEMKPDGLKKLY